MHRTLRDSATLLRHHGLTRWSLLLLPALLLVLTAPLQPEGAGMEAVRFLGFGLALVPLARVISILVELVISITALGSGLYSLLFLAVPTVFGIGEGIQPMAGTNALDRFAIYSLIVALLILGYYLLSFLLQLGTHRTFFNAEADDILQADGIEAAETDRSHLPRLPAILATMAVVSVLVVLVSEPLVDALETLVQGSHLSELFIGLFLLPLFGCTTITVLAVHWITENNELDWYEGVQLVALYGVMGLGSLLL
jgi:Ca2+:H+ antiporter